MADFVGAQLQEAKRKAEQLKKTAAERVRALQFLASQVEPRAGIGVETFAVVGAPKKQRPKKVSKGTTKDKTGSKRAHKVIKTFQERVLYPPHGARTNEFKKTRNRLIEIEKRGCIVCKVNVDSLTDPKTNRFGATQLEAHHRMIEHALAKAVDLTAFNDDLRPKLRERHKKPDGTSDYDQPFTQNQLEAWVDHHPDNMWFLCDVHHRHKFVGIHAITYPLWGPLDVLKPGTVG